MIVENGIYRGHVEMLYQKVNVFSPLSECSNGIRNNIVNNTTYLNFRN